MLVLSEDTKCAGNDSWKCEKIAAKFGSFIFTDNFCHAAANTFR